MSVKAQGKTTKILRFVDDIALLANTKKKLEEALNVTEAVINKNNIKINMGKPEVIASRTTLGTKRLDVQIGNRKIGEISEFCYLGSKITIDCFCNAGIHFRVGQTTIEFAKILQISLEDEVTNEKVSNFVKEEKSSHASIKRRRDVLIGHTLRHERLAGTILEGTVEGRRRKGRQRLKEVKQIMDDVGCSGYCEIKRLAQNRKR